MTDHLHKFADAADKAMARSRAEALKRSHADAMPQCPGAPKQSLKKFHDPSQSALPPSVAAFLPNPPDSNNQTLSMSINHK
jgi:hypothetical protein